MFYLNIIIQKKIKKGRNKERERHRELSVKIRKFKYNDALDKNVSPIVFLGNVF